MEVVFDPEHLTGFSEKEASEIPKKEGYNELPSKKKQSIFFHFTECS
jgi:Ca2+-transporting ATPase